MGHLYKHLIINNDKTGLNTEIKLQWKGETEKKFTLGNW